jgi:hypothetical protein
MADEFLDHDCEIAASTALLVERYHRLIDLDDPVSARPAISLATEIRHQETRLGLGPAERLRQRVRVVRADAAEREQRVPSLPVDGDPRDLLVGSS